VRRDAIRGVGALSFSFYPFCTGTSEQKPPVKSSSGPQKRRKTTGYCWSTPKCRNLGVQDAVFEGKKAEETSPRKSTPRTLKEDDQQYPVPEQVGKTLLGSTAALRRAIRPCL
jgi:hypothetical protein